MAALIEAIRYGIRQMFRQRGSSAVAVLTLTLGIGVSSAILSVIDATMLRPLPYRNTEQLVSVDPEEIANDGEASQASPSMEDMRNWQAADDVFSAVAGWSSPRIALWTDRSPSMSRCCNSQRITCRYTASLRSSVGVLCETIPSRVSRWSRYLVTSTGRAGMEGDTRVCV